MTTLRGERTIIKIKPEKSEFPQLVGNVLANVRDGPVGADNDLFIFLGFSTARLGNHVVPGSHHPAAAILPLLCKVNGPLLFEHMERFVPEMQVQDVALSREQIVADVDARHCSQVRLRNPHGDVLRQL